MNNKTALSMAVCHSQMSSSMLDSQMQSLKQFSISYLQLFSYIALFTWLLRMELTAVSCGKHPCTLYMILATISVTLGSYSALSYSTKLLDIQQLSQENILWARGRWCSVKYRIQSQALTLILSAVQTELLLPYSNPSFLSPMISGITTSVICCQVNYYLQSQIRSKMTQVKRLSAYLGDSRSWISFQMIWCQMMQARSCRPGLTYRCYSGKSLARAWKLQIAVKLISLAWGVVQSSKEAMKVSMGLTSLQNLACGLDKLSRWQTTLSNFITSSLWFRYFSNFCTTRSTKSKESRKISFSSLQSCRMFQTTRMMLLSISFSASLKQSTRHLIVVMVGTLPSKQQEQSPSMLVAIARSVQLTSLDKNRWNHSKGYCSFLVLISSSQCCFSRASASQLQRAANYRLGWLLVQFGLGQYLLMTESRCFWKICSRWVFLMVFWNFMRLRELYDATSCILLLSYQLYLDFQKSYFGETNINHSCDDRRSTNGYQTIDAIIGTDQSDISLYLYRQFR